MKRIVQFILLATFATLFSCSKNTDIQESDNQLQKATNKDIAALRISPDIVNLSISDAENVALLSNFYNQAHTKGPATREVENIVPITGKDGNTAAYAINYKDNNGYTIVSATKNYYPVLANVDMGTYNSSVEKTGISILVERYKEGIELSNMLPQDSIAKIRELWKIYEKQGSIILPSTKSTNDTRGDQVRAWMASGAMVYNLTDAAMVLPSDIYQQFCSMAATECHPKYDYYENSVVVETSIEPNYSNYMMSTLWDQVSPYNYSCPTIFYSNTLVGCGAVATAQIMKYHKWPSNKSWSSMPNILTASGATILSDFLHEVGENINTEFGLDQSKSKTDSVDIALKNTYNYLTGGLTRYNEATLRTSLANKRPVFVCGEKSGTNVGHAWVCDGYVYVTPGKHFQLYVTYVTSYDEPLYFANTYCGYDSFTYSNYYQYHMNWGWGGSHNGWFMNMMYPTNLEYTEKLQMIANIRPNK